MSSPCVFFGLSRPGLGEHLVFGHALHVVDLLGVLLDPGHQLRLVVGLERPAAFTFDALLHSAPPREIRLNRRPSQPPPFPHRGRLRAGAAKIAVFKIIAGRLWRMFGGSLLRIYLTGEVAVERGEQLLRDADLAGRQGRRAFFYLVSERERAVTQSDLAELLWPDSLPPSWPVALSAVISKLRQKLGALGLDRDRIIANAFRCYQFRPPDETWIDLEAAADAVHQAEGAVLANRPQAAYGASLIATTIARRPFLEGEDAPWVTTRRERLRDLLVRALDCRVEALIWNGALALAQDQARAAVDLEPYRESGYRRLMQVLVRRGDRAEAVRVYQQCRQRLPAETGGGAS